MVDQALDRFEVEPLNLLPVRIQRSAMDFILALRHLSLCSLVEGRLQKKLDTILQELEVPTVLIKRQLACSMIDKYTG